MPQCAKARVASPAALIAADVRVTVLPKSIINSLMIRLEKPIASKIKPINFKVSFRINPLNKKP